MPQDETFGTHPVSPATGADLSGAIVESTDDAILSLTPDGEITSVNKGAERLYGYSRDDLIGRPLSLLVPPARWADDQVVIKRVAGGEQVEHFETQRQTKTGRILDVAVTLSPIRSAGGDVVALSSIARDIGEQKEQVETFERLNRQRSEFVSKVSHELRNPLATIRGLAYLMTDASKETPVAERVQFSEAIVRQCDHLSKLVEDILQVSYMEAGDFSYAAIMYEPVQLLSDAVVEARAAYPSHTVSLEAPDSLPEMRGDPERLGQVLANLLANACRYSQENTHVTVRASTQAGELHIAIEDQGLGITEDEMPLLFRRFSRIPRREFRSLKGTGLGLYISKGIVEAHGGRISVTSVPERGSTFLIALPISN